MRTIFLSSILVTLRHVSFAVKLSGFTLTIVSVPRYGLFAIVVLRWRSCMKGFRVAFFLPDRFSAQCFWIEVPVSPYPLLISVIAFLFLLGFLYRCFVSRDIGAVFVALGPLWFASLALV